MMMVSGFRALKVWQRSMQVSAQVIQLTTAFPKLHHFGLVQQMQRASISIPSNIAEGYNRKSRKEYVQFLSIALGSTAELETQCELSMLAGLATQEDVAFITTELDEIGKMLRVMIQKLSSPSP
jgi:four helix bundle protein